MAGTGGRSHWPSDGEKLFLRRHFVALGVQVMTTKVAEAHRAHLWTGVRVVSSCGELQDGLGMSALIALWDSCLITALVIILFLYTFVSSES